MPARRRSVPSYLPHKQSGRARAVWTDAAGERHQKLLPGRFDSTESRAAFARVVAELAVTPLANRAVDGPVGITVAELLLAYLNHAERHYRTPDGEATSEFHETRLTARTLREMFADTPAAEFGLKSLKATRQAWINAGLARSECNRRTRIARRIFKWGACEELVPATVHQSLATVAGLQRGRTAARETEPVGPVEDAAVDAILPFLNRHVRGLVEFQRLGVVAGADIGDDQPEGVVRLLHGGVLGPAVTGTVRGNARGCRHPRLVGHHCWSSGW